MSAAPGEPPVFVTKLIGMIEDESNNHLIRWAPRGETFIVTDADRLAEEELPKYFKHSNFTSLVRQLNMYGFHKVTNAGGVKNQSKDSPQIWEFVHPCVQRGRPEMLVHVKRKENASTKKKMAREDSASVLSEMMALRDAHSTLRQRFDAVQTQNEALWREIAEHRHRHAQQQWKIERIMKYINALYVHGEAGAAFNLQSKKNRTMSAPPGGLGDGDESDVAPLGGDGLGDGRREDTPPQHWSRSIQPAEHISKQLMIPDLSHPEKGGFRDADELHRSLESHLGQYDAHLGRHQATLEKHMDDDFMASIFNPPHGQDILASEAGAAAAASAAAGVDFEAIEKAVGGDAHDRGTKRGAEEMTSDEDLLSAMEIFTPLHEFITDAVVPE